MMTVMSLTDAVSRLTNEVHFIRYVRRPRTLDVTIIHPQRAACKMLDQKENVFLAGVRIFARIVEFEHPLTKASYSRPFRSMK
jgi:hypothetical protein